MSCPLCWLLCRLGRHRWKTVHKGLKAYDCISCVRDGCTESRYRVNQ